MNLYTDLYDYANSTTLYAKEIYNSALENIHYEEIQKVALFAFKTLAIGLAAYLNPTFFALSFMFSVAFDKQVKNKLEEIWDKFKGHSYRFFCISASLAFIKLPVALVTYSIWVGAKLGSSFSKGL